MRSIFPADRWARGKRKWEEARILRAPRVDRKSDKQRGEGARGDRRRVMGCVKQTEVIRKHNQWEQNWKSERLLHKTRQRNICSDNDKESEVPALCTRVRWYINPIVSKFREKKELLQATWPCLIMKSLLFCGRKIKVCMANSQMCLFMP